MPVTSQGQVNLISREGLQNCTSESEVCAGFSRLLWYVCECIGGEKYEATVSTADVVGQPDLVVWRSRRTIEEKLALVIECKTPWGFDLDHHALLAEIYNSHYYHHEHWAPHDDKSYECPRGLTIGRKVFHAVRQLYGYMATNNSRYGILTTFTTTFLFKQDYQGKLFISKGLAADKFDPITVLEAIARLLLIDHLPAGKDLSEAKLPTIMNPSAQEMSKPSKSAGKKKRSPRNQREKGTKPATPRHLRKKTTESSASIVSTELDDIPVAIKAVDTCKKPALLDELQQECDAYVALKTLQGVCIPKLVRHAPVVLWEGILDGLVLSFIKGQTLEKMGLDGIATIPLECRQQAVQDLRKIHSLGVLHGDMAERNLIWCEDDRPRIVFVDFGRAVTSCDVEDGRLKYEEYELCGILQIRYRDTI
ncbi:hypothetical protein Ae201684P_004942 [Aphanomyces euteiches]|nr:hypothetical protein Ae201684P_004942 [Aphanomyces euteiches]